MINCCTCECSRFSCVRLSVTPWTAAHPSPLSMRFSRQEYWSGLLCPPPGDFPDQGIEPTSLMSPVLTGGVVFFCLFVCLFLPLMLPGKPLQASFWGQSLGFALSNLPHSLLGWFLPANSLDYSLAFCCHGVTGFLIAYHQNLHCFWDSC